ncbi:Protein disulfide-isomerase A3 [Glugoides intestinalis]
MILNFTSVAAMAVRVITQGSDQFKEETLNPTNSSDIQIIVDKQVPENSFILKLSDMSISGTESDTLKKLLEITSALSEMPTNIDSILSELSYRKTLDLEAKLKSGAYSFATIFTDDPELIKSLHGIEMVNNITFFLSTNKEKAASQNVPFPGVLAYNAQENNLIKMPLTSGSFDSLIAAIQMPSFSRISHDNFKYLQTLEQKLFYIIDKNGEFEKNMERFHEYTKKCSGYAKFIYFTPEEVPALIPLLNTNEAEYPLLLSLAKEGKGIARSLEPEKFMDSVQKLITQSGERLQFSSKIPADNETRAVKILNTETLPKIMANSDKDVLVAFISTSCRYCMALKPELEKFSKLLSDNKVPLFVGTYNTTENEDQNVTYEIEGVPTLYFLKKGSKVPMKVPTEVRAVADLLSLISKEGETSKIDLNKFTEAIKGEKGPEGEKSAPGDKSAEGKKGEESENLDESISEEDALTKEAL